MLHLANGPAPAGPGNRLVEWCPPSPNRTTTVGQELNARDRENFEKEVQRLTQRLHNTEKSLQTLTKDYISAQKEKEQAER